MNRLQERTLSMCINVKDFLAAQNAIAVTLPNYSNYHSRFESNLEQIIIKQGEQLLNKTKVSTQSKTELRMLCTTSIEKLLLALNAYAMVINDAALKQNIATTISNFKTAADTIFASQSNNLYHIGFPYKTDLVAYGIEATFFANFRSEIDSYTVAISSPRQMMIDNAEVTTDLKNLFLQIKKDIDDLTTLVSIKKFSEPIFYSKFVASSRIINVASRVNALNFVVKDENGKQMPKFLFSFKRLSDNKVMTYKTNANGTIVRTNFKEGPYELTVSNVNYTPFTNNINVVANKTLKLTVNIHTIDKTIVF